MMPWEHNYFITTLIASALYFILHFTNVRKSEIAILPINIFYSLFLISRDFAIGVDAQSYYDFFDEKDVVISEPMFNILKLIHLPPELILFIISLLSITFVYKYFEAISKRPYLLMGFYFCTFVFLNTQINIIRQGLSIGLFHLSLVFFYRKRYFRYYFYALLSILTHYSSVLIYLSVSAGAFFFKKRKNFVGEIIIATIILYITDISSIVVWLAEYYGIGTVAWYLSQDFSKPWELKHIFYLLVPFGIYMIIKLKKITPLYFEIPLIVLLSIFFCAMLFKQGDMFADRLIYYTVPSFIVLFDIFSIYYLKGGHIYILIGSLIWLIKTTYFQLPSWFINYG